MPRRRPVQAIAANANRATTKSRASVYNERGKSKVSVADCEDPKANNRERSSGGEKVSGDGNAESCGTTASNKSTTPQPRWSQMDTTFQYLHKKFKKMECVENSSGSEDPGTRTSAASTTTTTITPTSTTKVLEDQEEHSNSNTSQLALEALFQVTGRELEKINETDSPPAKDPKEKEVNGNSGCFVTTPPVSKNPGRHVCPFCGHGCAKPSILQKHIRAHTNERPYTCEPCGFAFKTTSNLYKHRKSRAHALKLGLATLPVTGVKEDEEPEEDVAEATVEEEEEDTAEEPVDEDHVAQTTHIYKPKFHSVSTKRVFSAEEEQAKNAVPSLAKRRNEQLQLKLKIPKPPVVTASSISSSTPSSSASSSSSPSRSPGSAAASPAKGSGGGDRTPKFASPEYVQQRISKLISENAAIVEIQDPLWQKRNMRHSSSLSPGGVGSGQSQSPGELKSPPSSHSPLTPSSLLQLSPRTPPVNTPSTPVIIPKSKLASALLGRTFSPQPSPPPPPTPTLQTAPPSSSPSYSSSSSSSSSAASSTKVVVPTSVIVSNGVVNPAGRNAVDSAVKSFPTVDANVASPQSKKSLIYDLLLKPREGIATQSSQQVAKKLPDAEPAQVPVTMPVLSSPQPVPVTVAATGESNRHFCLSCNMRFQKVENLQAHQSYYCFPQNAAHSAVASTVSYPGIVVSKADCGPPPKARGRPKGSKNRPKNPLDGTTYPRVAPVNHPFYDPRGPDLALCMLKSRAAQGGNGNNGLSDYDGPILKRHLLARADHSPPPAKKQQKCRVVTPPQSAEYVQCQPFTMAFAAPHNQSHLRHGAVGKVQVCANSSSTNFSFSDPVALRSVSDGEDNLVSNRIPAPGVIKQSNSSPSSSSSSTTFEQTIAKPVLNSGGTVRQVPDAKESPGGSSSSCFPMVSMGSSRVGARTGTLSGGGVVAGESEMLIASSALTIPIAISSVPINTYPIDISHLQINVPTTSSRPTRLALPSWSATESPKASVINRLGSSSQSSCSSMSPVSTPVKGSFGSEFSDNSPEDVVAQSPRSPKNVKSIQEQGTASVRRAVPATRPTTLSLRPPERPLSLTEKFLVSPETPRPKKKYAQCFHNGQHYTYLALKQSTRVFYCCIHWAQPMYVPQDAAPGLSMYSVWKTVPAEPDPLGLTPSQAMCLYDSRNRYSMYTMAQSKSPLQVTHSSYWSFKEHSRKGDGKECTTAAVSSVAVAADDGDVDGEDSDTVINVEDDDEDDEGDSRWKDAYRGSGKMTEREVSRASVAELADRDFVEDVTDGDSDGTEDEDRSSKHKSGGEEDGVAEPKRVRIFEGGFKSNEDYTYVRGRGRGKYVCEECGIRCKKPSMLKKHIRTHTDVRPYTCKHCNFSFKTKGNLTKHMKSKAHHKKCVELGLDPIPVTIDDSQIDEEALVRQERIEQQRKHFANDNDDDDDEEEDEDGEEEDEYGRNFDYGDEDEEMMDVEDDSRSVLSLGQFEDAEPCDELIRENPSGMDGDREPPVVNSRMDREAAHSLLDLSKPNDGVAMKISRLRNHKGNSALNELTPNSSDLKEISIRRPGFLSNCPPVSTAVIVSPMVEDRDVLIGNPRVVWSVDLPECSTVQSPLYSSSTLQLLDCENEADDSASTGAYRLRGHGIRSEGESEVQVSRQALSKDKSVLVPTPKSSLKPTSPAGPALEGDGDQPMDLSMPQTRHGVPCKAVGACDAYVEEDADFVEDPWEARRSGANAGYNAYRAETPPSVGCVDSHRDRAARYENMLSAAEDDEDDEDDAGGPLQSLRSSPGPLYLAPMFAGSRPHEYRRSHANTDGSGAWDQNQDEEMRHMHSYADTAVEESRENERSPSCDTRARNNSTALDPMRCDAEDFRGLPSPPSAAAVAAMGVASAQKKADDTQLSSAPQPTTVVSQFGFPLRVSKVNSTASSTSSSEVNAKQMLDYSPAVSGSGLQRSIDDGKCVCSICNKSFSKPSQLRLHVNIHYFERPFRCESCAISFRTKGHLQKHKRSVSHYNKVNMNLTFGTPTTDNPRPFKCADCKIAFRIHGHLAKHLRSKMHIMKLECLGKLPFGTYAEFERSGANLNEIDTTDCENSLDSLRAMACKFFEDTTQRWPRKRTTSGCSSDDLSDGVPFVESPVDAPPVSVQPTPPPLPPPSSSAAAHHHQPSTVAAGGSGGPETCAASTRHRTLSIGEESSLSTDLAEMWSQKSLLGGGGGGGSGGGQGLVADNLPKSTPLPESLESMAADCPGFSGRIVHQRSHDHLALVQDYEDVSDVDSESELPTRNGYPCRLCGKVLKSAKFLQMHCAEHSARMVDAEDGDADGDCASMVTAATTYPALVQQASNADGFDCELCERNFSSRSDLKQHLQTHALPRPFVCEVCDAGFTTAQNLKVHRYTHTRLMQDESFACNECRRVFDDFPSLENHLVRYHSTGALGGQEQVRCRIRQVGEPSAASDFALARPAA